MHLKFTFILKILEERSVIIKLSTSKVGMKLVRLDCNISKLI